MQLLPAAATLLNKIKTTLEMDEDDEVEVEDVVDFHNRVRECIVSENLISNINF